MASSGSYERGYAQAGRRRSGRGHEYIATMKSNRTEYRLAVMAAVSLAVLLGAGCGPSDQGRMPPANPAALEQKAREQPTDFLTQLRWGEALVQAKRFDTAMPALMHAEQLKPSDPRPYAWLGIVAIAEHRTRDARDLLQTALRQDGANATALRALANLDANEGHLRQAIQGFEKLVHLKQDDADAWQRLGLLLLNGKDTYRGLDALTRAAALAPNDLLTQRVLGLMALGAGRLDQANRAFRAVLASEPNDPEVLAGLATVMMRMDPSTTGLTAAEQQADLSLQSSPTAGGYRARGQIHMAQHRFREAIEDFDSCLRFDPADKDIYVFLSQCYASEGQPELARRASAEFDRLATAQRQRRLKAARAAEAAR